MVASYLNLLNVATINMRPGILNTRRLDVSFMYGNIANQALALKSKTTKIDIGSIALRHQEVF